MFSLLNVIIPTNSSWVKVYGRPNGELVDHLALITPLCDVIIYFSPFLHVDNRCTVLAFI